MARIQVDFDEVMLFGDLHRDISTALDGHRRVFALNGSRLDQVVAAFGLEGVGSHTSFAGKSIAWSLDDASDRARRVASSLDKTSTRIFRHAQPVDDSFNWGGAVWGFLTGPALGPLSALLELGGGEITGWVAQQGSKGLLATPGLVVVAPAFLLVSGGLAIFDGVTQVHESMNDYWGGVAGSLKTIAGGIAVTVGVVGATFLLVGAGTAAAFFTLPFVAGALAVGAVLGTAALVIDHRETLGRLLGFGKTDTERSGNALIQTGEGGRIPLSGGSGALTIADFGAPANSLLPSGALQGGASVALQGPGARRDQPGLTVAGPSKRGAPEISVRSVPPYAESGLGYGTGSHFGFFFANEYDATSRIEYLSDGRANTTLHLYDGYKLDFGDVKTLIDLLQLPRTIAEKSVKDLAKFHIDAQVGTGVHTTYHWNGMEIWAATSIYQHWVAKQTSASNQWFLGGAFRSDDYYASRRAGEVPAPTAVRSSTSSLRGSFEIGVKGKGSASSATGFAHISGDVQSYVTKYNDGTYGSGIIYESGAGVELAGGLAELGGLGEQGSAGSGGARLTAGGVEVIRDADGSPVSVRVSERLDNVGHLDAQLLALSQDRAASLSVERVVSFDFDDPQVRAAFGSDPSLSDVLDRYVLHRILGEETVVASVETEDRRGMAILTGGTSSSSTESSSTNVSYRPAGSESFSRVVP